MYATAPGNYKPAPVLEKGEAGLRQLAELLEHEQAFRSYWEWNYATTGNMVSPTCGTAGCAVGLSWVTWPDQVMIPTTAWLSEHFGQPRDWMEDTFLRGGAVFGCAQHEVTPGMVAARIRERVGY